MDKAALKRLTKRTELYIFIVLIALCIVIHVISGGQLLVPGKIFTILRAMVTDGIFALGCLVVMISGGFDLSFPAIAALSYSLATTICLNNGWTYILNAARTISEGRLDLSALSAGSTQQALEALCALDGVGLKVDSCAALFGLQKLDVFPVDVWMKKALRAHYPAGLDPQVFGGYAGIAQQYMFYYQRLNGR